jgi:hypothetical protein
VANHPCPSLYADALGNAVNLAAEAHAAPHWQRVSTRPLARGQDHRALWHGNPPPQVQADPTYRHRVANWQVPLLLGLTLVAAGVAVALGRAVGDFGLAVAGAGLAAAGILRTGRTLRPATPPAA